MQGIEGVFFDLGGTLRIVHHDAAYEQAAKDEMARLAGSSLSGEEFYAKTELRYAPYREWALEQSREAHDFELWHEWLLPEADEQLVRQNCHELTYQYRQTKGIRRLAPHSAEAIRLLHGRGYKLGIISNLIGEIEIKRWLTDDGLTPYFDAVILSSVTGLRKPDPAVYALAGEKMGLPLHACASIADNPDRDVTGAREAGLGACLIYLPPDKYEKKKDKLVGDKRPDVIFSDFSELERYFPERS